MSGGGAEFYKGWSVKASLIRTIMDKDLKETQKLALELLMEEHSRQRHWRHHSLQDDCQ